MAWILVAELAVMLACIWLGSRHGGIALGFWGGIGLLILSFIFRETPAKPPVDVMLIILAVTCATATMQAAGGIAFFVRMAEKIIKRYPERITFIAPLVAYIFTFAAGTGHILYPLLPVIHDTALRNGIRPERPISVSVVASLQGITASPVSAAMAAFIVVVEASGYSLPKIMLIAVPSTLVGVLVASLVMLRYGKELEDDPEFQRRVAAGEVEDIPLLVKAQRKAKRDNISVEDAKNRLAPTGARTESATDISEGASASVGADGRLEEDITAESNGAKPGAPRITAAIFLATVVLVVIFGAVPSLRPPGEDGEPLSIAILLQILMLSAAAIMVAVTNVKVGAIATSSIAKTGLIAIVGIFGLAWLGLTVIQANEELIVGGLEGMVTKYPWMFAVALFACSIVLFSQASTTRTLMPLGLSLGLGPAMLTGMWPAVNGAFFLPTYGTIVAAMNFDRTGTTRIGKFVFNHSFMLPGLVAIAAAVATGMTLATIIG
ncbi:MULTISPECIES: anaerobic C4-dicarboxylate transporter [Corynebacterium]|uniref:anaerobic C4-dicarboxylate transporter n=1 Tax=Corynebacterium TaxID=1716 RepID=UPI002934F4E4|nr:anaerobic C4-dicarboxylate transporter [Corynebacterium sp. CTNIH16]MDV2426566.1 anaerobic C4-dicarboxylate transporter [Corynebacterium sp. CTNIH16]